MFNKSIYEILNITKNLNTLNMVNTIVKIDDYNMIIPNLYLGNIKSANDIEFLKNNKIEAIINCTENEPFNDYFNNKFKLRLSVNDSKNIDNMIKFKNDITDAIDFIETCLTNNKPVYVHCYWGLMRSATVIACYLIKKFNMLPKDAICIIKEQRPRAISSIYNFNEILDYVYVNYNIAEQQEQLWSSI